MNIRKEIASVKIVMMLVLLGLISHSNAQLGRVNVPRLIPPEVPVDGRVTFRIRII